MRGFRYVKARDAIDPLPRPQGETRQCYKRLIACVARWTRHEIFTATPPDVVEAVVFNGRLGTTDRATGKPARPNLLSVSAERAVFEDLVLGAVEPAACLTQLNALVSPNPYDLEAVEPFIASDLKRFRFTDDLDVIASLDSRPNLLNLTPAEFEHNATTGTTSWFGRASEQFANRNRITLINGAELKQLLKKIPR